MRITIIALGSRGDVQPYIVLGRKLREAGHRVRVATFNDFAPLVLSSGLDFHSIRGDAQGLLQSASREGMLSSGSNPLKFAIALRRSYASLADSIGRDLSSRELNDTELLLNQLPGNLYGVDLAEKWGIPLATVGVIPMARSRHSPMFVFPGTLSWVPGYNAWTYRIAEQLLWLLFRASINHWRVSTLGLSSHPTGGPFSRTEREHIPVIYGFSEKVVPRQPDWGEHIHLTGWWLPEEPAWEAPGELLEFLASGPAPVFIGFGSMPVDDPARITRLIVQAVQSSMRRAILHAGWAGLGKAALPGEIFPVTYVPYGWLFPRMSAIVHHGGSGTSGLAFHSGVPFIVVPFVFDQFYWGKRAFELGVGTMPLPFKHINSVDLAGAITQVINSQEMHTSSANLSLQLQAERGTERAVKIIESLS